MEKREQIAAMMLQGMLARGIYTSSLTEQQAAQMAVKYADALLEALKP